MSPELIRLRVRLVRRQTLRRVERTLTPILGSLLLLWLFTRFVL